MVRRSSFTSSRVARLSPRATELVAPCTAVVTCARVAIAFMATSITFGLVANSIPFGFGASYWAGVRRVFLMSIVGANLGRAGGPSQREAKRSVAASSARVMPGSITAWPASGTTTSSASGHARCSAQAESIGQTTS